MPKWATMVLIISVLFLGAAIWERWRVLGMEAWGRANGFRQLQPFHPKDYPAVASLAAQLTGRDADHLRWVTVFSGPLGPGRGEMTLAMFSHWPQGRKTDSWFTLAVWPAQGPNRPVSERWTREGQFALLDGHAGFMKEYMLTASRAGELVSRAAAGGQ